MTRTEFDRQCRRMDEIADMCSAETDERKKRRLEREYRSIRRRLNPYLSGERRFSNTINAGFSEGGNA